VTSPAKSRRTYSAIRVIPIVIGLAAALLLLPVMTLGYLGANDNTGRLLTTNRDALLDGFERKIRDSLDGPAGQMAQVARMIADGRVDPDDRAAFSIFMNGIAQGQGSLVSTSWLEREGPLRSWTRDGRGEDIRDRNTIPVIDDIWERAERERTPYWRGPAMSQLVGAAIIPHIQPVVRRGEMIGVLITVLTSESISRFLTSMDDAVIPFVLVGRERVLAHPNIRTTHMISSSLPALDAVDDPALAVMWKDPRRPAQTVAGRSEIHWSWLGDTYQAQVYSYRSLSGYGSESWLLGFHRSSLDTFRERWIIQGLFWGSGLLLLVAVLASYALSRWAIRPAGEIAEAARALERLDFDAVERPAIARSRIAEVRDISQAFTRAAAALKHFRTYVPRTLVDRLIRMDDDSSEASDREVSVLFMDLAGYTGFSEGRSAGEVAAYLNGIFAEVGPIIEASGGVIDKYTGDGLMAVWGAPIADADHASKAWTASLRILDHMTPLVRAGIAADPAKCRMRLGLHAGRALAGDLGFAGRINYTVVGRTVNIAQRTQTALKDRMGDAPVALAITEAFRTAIDLPKEGLAALPVQRGGAPAWRVLWLTSATSTALERKPAAA
jgi:adenylate cyclase